jgi:peptidoglycan/LPS O-acetylase OafA/YrhL
MKLIYRPEIDGLRAIAVVSVILYHSEISLFSYQIFKGGYLGVDIFFVISGYLITSIILKELKFTGSFSFKNFYERRIRRIIPLLLLVILASTPFAITYLLPADLIDYSKSILYSLVFSSNFYFHYSGQEYGAQDAAFKPLLHTWSLSIEEQYYILFPIIFFIIFQNLRKYIIHILIFLFLASLILSDFGSKYYASLNFYVLPTRAWELLSGSILAYFEIKYGKRNKNKILNLLLPSFGLILIIFFIMIFDNKIYHPSFYTLPLVIGTCLIIWFSNKIDIVTKLLSSKLFVSIGLISYSLYLWHYPIFAFYRYSFADGSIIKKLFIFIGLIIISMVSYIFIEKKFRNRNFEFKKILKIIILIIFVIIISNIYFIYKKGFPEKAIIDKISLDRNYYLSEITSWEKKNKNNKILSKNKKSVIIVGDSHAANFALLFQTNKELFSEYNFFSMKLNKFNDFIEEKNINNTHDSIIKNFDIIIFSFFYDSNEIQNVENLIKSIKEINNKKIILTTNNPPFNLYGSRFTDLDFYLIKNKKRPTDKELSELEKKYYNSFQFDRPYFYFNEELEKLSKKYNLKLLDKSLYQCNNFEKKCDVLTDQNKKINWDNHHHTLDGAKYLGKKIYNMNWLKLDNP